MRNGAARLGVTSVRVLVFGAGVVGIAAAYYLNRAGHEVTVTPGTLLHRIVDSATMAVNSAHHQAVKDVGAQVVVNAVTSDGVIEGIESTVHDFCLGVQWHPEFAIDPGDEKIFQALVAAARQ